MPSTKIKHNLHSGGKTKASLFLSSFFFNLVKSFWQLLFPSPLYAPVCLNLSPTLKHFFSSRVLFSDSLSPLGCCQYVSSTDLRVLIFFPFPTLYDDDDACLLCTSHQPPLQGFTAPVNLKVKTKCVCLSGTFVSLPLAVTFYDFTPVFVLLLVFLFLHLGFLHCNRRRPSLCREKSEREGPV